MTTCPSDSIGSEIDKAIDANTTVNALKSDVEALKCDMKEVKFEVKRIGVILEDNNSKLDTALELLSNSMKTSKHVDTHETRLTNLESTQNSLVETVKSHSKQLKATS